MGQVLGEQVTDKDCAGDNSQYQQDHAGPHQLEQQRLHGLKGWQVTDQRAVVVLLELAVLKVE